IDHILSLFFYIDPAPTEFYTLSLHDALPISWVAWVCLCSARRPSRSRRAKPPPRGSWPRWTSQPRSPRRTAACSPATKPGGGARSEEHTSELQSQSNLVCRLLLEKKKTTKKI